MKKFAFCLIFILIFVSAAFAQEVIETGGYQPPLLLDEPNKVEELPQPYEGICMQLSNGKDDVLKRLRLAVSPKLGLAETEILQSIGEAAAELYTGDPKLGMAKFCMNCLEGYATAEEQARVIAAFTKGYKGCGVAMISFTGCDREPVTKMQMYSGTHAWFIPFTQGSSFTFNIFGKSDEFAKVWKIVPEKAVYKEWKGGFWEREITVNGK